MHSREDRRRIADPCTIIHAHEHKIYAHAQKHIMVGNVLIAINYYQMQHLIHILCIPLILNNVNTNIRDAAGATQVSCQINHELY